MKRSAFLRRAAAAVAAATVADRLPDTASAAVSAPESVAPTEALPWASPVALEASGGLCSPLPPFYPLGAVTVSDRPVLGALPELTARRGGIRYR